MIIKSTMMYFNFFFVDHISSSIYASVSMFMNAYTCLLYIFAYTVITFLCLTKANIPISSSCGTVIKAHISAIFQPTKAV